MTASEADKFAEDLSIIFGIPRHMLCGTPFSRYVRKAKRRATRAARKAKTNKRTEPK